MLRQDIKTTIYTHKLYITCGLNSPNNIHCALRKQDEQTRFCLSLRVTFGGNDVENVYTSVELSSSRSSYSAFSCVGKLAYYRHHWNWSEQFA